MVNPTAHPPINCCITLPHPTLSSKTPYFLQPPLHQTDKACLPAPHQLQPWPVLISPLLQTILWTIRTQQLRALRLALSTVFIALYRVHTRMVPGESLCRHQLIIHITITRPIITTIILKWVLRLQQRPLQLLLYLDIHQPREQQITVIGCLHLTKKLNILMIIQL